MRASLSTFARRALALLAAVAATSGAGCGAKTGLRLPDVSRPPVCVPGRFPLERRSADVLFVIDRSNSMFLGIDGNPSPAPGQDRWTILRGALAATLPAVAAEANLGAAFYPAPGNDPSAPTRVQCSASGAVDVPPARNNANAILRIFDTTRPYGGTPTGPAIDVAANFLANSGRRSRAAQYIVLATDGGPNCNFDLDAQTCPCTSRDATGNPNCATGNLPYNCIDRDRTLAAIRSARARMIDLFVIGIDDPRRDDLRDVLNEMAREGGRPNTTGATAYYSVRRREDLVGAFNTIQRAIARCAFVTQSQPDDPDGITIEVNGVAVPRDPARREGWEWTDREFGEITLFGSACDRANAPPQSVSAVVACRDAGAGPMDSGL